MSWFKSKKNSAAVPGTSNVAILAELALNAIADGVVIIDNKGVIKFANPAAAIMTGYNSAERLVGLDYKLIIKLEKIEGAPAADGRTKLDEALQYNQAITTREYAIVAAETGHKLPVALTVVPANGMSSDRIITFRDITKELEEAGAQAEFISTASHEMRTPVASIEGYLGLVLNPQTATIDERARQYVEAAHAASQHLGHLFKDLLDVTKLDDGRLRVDLVPVDIVATVRDMADAHAKEMLPKHLKYSFGTAGAVNNETTIEPKVYAAVDLSFLHEILDNLIENAIKYTPDGGEIWVNARGDGDKVLINVTDTGIGVAVDDLTHIFQKFYRVDNSQTRQIGGTGLGLYLVKQRAEALGGRVWCESSFGDGSTFFVSLPRLSEEEYNKQKLAYDNAQAVQSFHDGSAAANNAATVGAAPVDGNAVSMTSVAPAAPATSLVAGPIAEMVQAAQNTAKIQNVPATPVTPVTNNPSTVPVQGDIINEKESV